MWAVGLTNKLAPSSAPNLVMPLSQRLSRKRMSRLTRIGPDAALALRVRSMALGTGRYPSKYNPNGQIDR